MRGQRVVDRVTRREHPHGSPPRGIAFQASVLELPEEGTAAACRHESHEEAAGGISDTAIIVPLRVVIVPPVENCLQFP